jgi:hypothetical protein
VTSSIVSFEANSRISPCVPFPGLNSSCHQVVLFALCKVFAAASDWPLKKNDGVGSTSVMLMPRTSRDVDDRPVIDRVESVRYGGYQGK